MSIEFCIKQNGEKHCYSNWTMNLKSFLTALYSNENPYEALMSLDRNNQLSDDNYTRDKRNGLITYDIDFDRDTITRHEKGRQIQAERDKQNLAWRGVFAYEISWCWRSGGCF